MLIEEQWDKLPIPERIKMAEAAGISGKVGSASWNGMHHLDREALMKWSKGGTDGSANDGKAETGRDTSDGEAPEARGVHDGDSGVVSVLSDGVGRRRKAEHKRDDPDPSAGQGSEERMEKAAGVTQDYLLWVGYQSYPTIKSFVEEGDRLGVSRRISRVPNGLKLAESKVFLAHDEGETGDAVIFGYFIPTSIELIVYRNENGIPDELKGVATPITLDQAASEPERGCGFRDNLGATYLSGHLFIFSPYKDYNRIIDSGARRFRGIKRIDADKIICGPSKVAPSELHRVPKNKRIKVAKGDPWSDKEKQILRDLLTEFKPWRALREMSKRSGRSVEAITYQYSKIKKEESKFVGSNLDAIEISKEDNNENM